MKEAWAAADIGLLRTRPQKATWYLAVHRPASVFSASIANNFTTFPMSAVNLTLTTGDYTKAKKGMTLRVGSNMGGSEKGIIRIRKDMSAETLVEIAEAGSGLVDFQANDVVTVMDQFLPWPIFNRYDSATSAWLNDYNEPHTSQLIQYGPYVNMGPPAAGFIPPGGSLTVNSFGNRSINMGDAAASAHTAAWTFPDGGTGAIVGTPISPMQALYDNASPSGSYMSLTLTDANGNSAIGRRLIFAYDDRTQPFRVQFGEISGGIRDGGYKTQIRVSGSATSESFPDIAEVVIFEEASFGATASELGGNYPWRSNIVFRGWIDGKTVTINPFTGDAMFQAYTINKLMDRADNDDTFLISVIDPPQKGASGWVGASDLTADRSAWNLLRYRSTVGEITDFYPANGLASKIGLMLYSDLARQSLWKQFSKIYREQGTYGYASADMQSNLFGMHDAQITGGSAVLPLTEIAKQERRDAIIIQERDVDENSETHFLSIASDTKVWTRSPGDIIGYFGKKKEHARGMYADQHTLTQWVGNWRALLNSKFPKVKIPLSGNMRLDSVPQSRISMSMSAVDNVRGYSWDNKEFFPYKTRLVYDAQAGMVLSELEAEEVVYGVGGSAVTFPTITKVPTRDDLPDTDTPPDIPGDTPGDGFGTAYLMTMTKLWRTSDLSVSTPAWTEIGADDYYDFILDPWNPSTTGFILADDGVYKSTDLNAATPTWNKVLDYPTVAQYWKDEGSGNRGNIDTATMRGSKIIASINYEGYVGFIYTIYNGCGIGSDCENLYYSYSFDGGASWNHSGITNWSASLGLNVTSWALNYISTDLISGHVVLYVGFGASTIGPSGYRGIYIYKSTDSGATWTQQSTKNPGSGPETMRTLTCPHEGNDSGNKVYFSHHVGSEKSSDSGVTWDAFAPTASAQSHAMRHGIESHTPNGQQFFFWSATDSTLYVTENDGASWDAKSATGLGSFDKVCAAGGFPYNSQQYYVVPNTGIFVSTDGGDTFTDKTGNITKSGTGSSTLHGLTLPTRFRRCVIVPNWLE